LQSSLNSYKELTINDQSTPIGHKVIEKPCTYAVSLELTTKSNDPGPRGTYAKDNIAPVCPIRKHLGVIYRTAFKVKVL
jgi:hypothetical protein